MAKGVHSFSSTVLLLTAMADTLTLQQSLSQMDLDVTPQHPPTVSFMLKDLINLEEWRRHADEYSDMILHPLNQWPALKADLSSLDARLTPGALLQFISIDWFFCNVQCEIVLHFDSPDEPDHVVDCNGNVDDESHQEHLLWQDEYDRIRRDNTIYLDLVGSDWHSLNDFNNKATLFINSPSIVSGFIDDQNTFANWTEDDSVLYIPRKCHNVPTDKRTMPLIADLTIFNPKLCPGLGVNSVSNCVSTEEVIIGLEMHSVDPPPFSSYQEWQFAASTFWWKLCTCHQMK